MTSPLRDPWLIMLCASRALSALVFVTVAACMSVLVAEWHMTAAEGGSIVSAFQATYAVSLLICSWLAQRFGARRVLLQSSFLIAIAACLFAQFARDHLSAALLYAVVAASLGGNYTTSIMLIADRYAPAQRGSAMGALLGSTSMGYALGLAAVAIALPIGGYVAGFWATAIGPVLSSIVLWLALRGTPNRIHPRVPDVRFTGAVLSNPRAVRLSLGYFSHGWELLGMWAWAPAFLAACMLYAGNEAETAAQIGAYLMGALHLAGMAASLTMGRLSDLWGRRAVLLLMASAGAACSFSFGWLIGGPIWLIVAVALLYGFTAVGDSAVFSTAFTEAVDPAYLGSALAVRSLIAFGTGAVSPWVFGLVLDATNVPGTTPTAWGWAFIALGIGGVGATVCAYGLRRGT
jgi:MFS family permease